MTQKIKAVIVGASGYTGVELLRLLKNHPQVSIQALVAESNAGKDMSQLYGHFLAGELPVLQKFDELDFTQYDVAFCCLPHGTSQELISQIIQKTSGKTTVIDLSADFRLDDVNAYQQWYNKPHAAPNLQPQAAYGLSEIHAEKVKNSNIIACPGCYPTSILLPLLPLAASAAINLDGIIADSKSGASGAGRSVKQHLLYTEINENIWAYSVEGHRHKAEAIEQLSLATGNKEVDFSFVPHLVPMDRGIISTIYVKLAENSTLEDCRKVLNDKYNSSPFVHLLPEGKTVSTASVRGTNNCHIALHKGQLKGYITITSVIDNLIKGAGGQAVQNMNIRFGLEQSTGLNLGAVFP